MDHENAGWSFFLFVWCLKRNDMAKEKVFCSQSNIDMKTMMVALSSKYAANYCENRGGASFSKCHSHWSSFEFGVHCITTVTNASSIANVDKKFCERVLNNVFI